MCEEWPENPPAKIKPGIAAELQRAERAGVIDLLAVMPRPHHQKYFVIAGVLRLERFVDGRRAVNVFLIPQAVHQHGRNFQRLRGENLVHGLLLPE